MLQCVLIDALYLEAFGKICLTASWFSGHCRFLLLSRFEGFMILQAIRGISALYFSILLVGFRFVPFVGVQVLQKTNQCFWNGNCRETLSAPDKSQSPSECLWEIKTDHLFPQILSNNLNLIKSKISFAWLPGVLVRNYRPCLQLWEKRGKAIRYLVRDTGRIVRRDMLHALHSAGHETISLHKQPVKRCRSL